VLSRIESSSVEQALSGVLPSKDPRNPVALRKRQPQDSVGAGSPTIMSNNNFIINRNLFFFPSLRLSLLALEEISTL